MRARHRHVDAPGIVLQIRAAQPRDRIHHQQRRVARRINRLAHSQNVRGHARRRLVVHHAHRLDLALRILAQARLDQIRLHPATPARRVRHMLVDALIRHHLGLQPQTRRHLDPQRREMPRLIHQHLVAGAGHIGQRRLPRPRARRRIDHHRLLRLENLADITQHLAPQRTELRPAMIDGRQAHRPQNAIRHGTGARNLQKMAACRVKIELQHVVFLSGYILNAKYKN
ncbi:hypothetical protein SDC9_74018 [bioreactor metagenome]|uniref:Uncharacterized protein n=1 Tax=bioreactor metagenome TaxID=1076179 RepID=A0A644YG76_9ZZZZ